MGLEYILYTSSDVEPKKLLEIALRGINNKIKVEALSEEFCDTRIFYDEGEFTAKARKIIHPAPPSIAFYTELKIQPTTYIAYRLPWSTVEEAKQLMFKTATELLQKTSDDVVFLRQHDQIVFRRKANQLVLNSDFGWEKSCLDLLPTVYISERLG